MAAVAMGCLFATTTRAQVNQNVGNLAPGESVTITFEVTINSPLPASVTQLSAQGTVTHNGGILNTDDPDTVAANDATITPLAQDFDFGDAPDPTYPTLLANNGARHFIPQGGATLYLGATAPDAETDGQPNVGATGDGADEDGVTLPSSFRAGLSSNVTVNVTGGGGLLNAWIDWNADGDWSDTGEQIATNLSVSAGANALSISAPASAPSGSSFARFRLGTETNLTTTGQAADGEVEDYALALASNAPPVAVADTLGASQGTPASAPVVKLLANDSDPDGDALAVTGTSATSTNGGIVFFDVLLGVVNYTPAGSFTGEDRFTYTLSDGRGGTAQGTVVVTVTSTNAPSQNLASVTPTANGKMVRFYGIPGQNYIVQSADAVSGPWSNLSPPITAAANGLVEYEDTTQPVPPVRFYRTVAAP